MEKRLKILKLLEQGKINAEEAEKLLKALDVGGTKRFRSEEDVDFVKLELKGCNAEVFQEGSQVTAEYRGFFRVDKNRNTTIVKFTGDGKIYVPENAELEVSLRYGNLEMEVVKDLEITAKGSNAEILIKKPVNLFLKSHFSNIEIYYLCEPDATFHVENRMGSVDNQFRDSIGKKSVEIVNNFGTVTIKQRR